MSEDYFQYAVTYGLGIVLSIMMALFMGWLLKKVLNQQEVREERLANIIQKDIVQLNEKLSSYDSKSNKIAEDLVLANRYQREEHVEMIKCLNAINLSINILLRENNLILKNEKI